MADAAAVELTVDGETHTIRMGDLTALDAKDFRREVGVSLAQVFTEGSADLDVVAGLLWLARRKRDPSLRFAQVAKSLTYSADFDLVESNGTAEGDEDPEA